jgi:hypothetical protein
MDIMKDLTAQRVLRKNVFVNPRALEVQEALTDLAVLTSITESMVIEDITAQEDLEALKALVLSVDILEAPSEDLSVDLAMALIPVPSVTPALDPADLAAINMKSLECAVSL